MRVKLAGGVYSPYFTLIYPIRHLTMLYYSLCVMQNGREHTSNGSGRRRGSADGKAAMFGTAMDQDDEPIFRVNLGGYDIYLCHVSEATSCR